jgi:hypothetical protein
MPSYAIFAAGKVEDYIILFLPAASFGPLSPLELRYNSPGGRGGGQSAFI